MDPTPSVSIVLPTHNGIAYLDEAIESVVAQTRSDWELIVVDDASNDDTPKRVQAWESKDDRIHAVLLSKNRKLPGALNEGFQRARGRYFTWTSDDNRFAPNALERLVENIEGSPPADLVYAGFRRIDAAGHLLETYRPEPPQALAWTNSVGACFLYRREVHETLDGYDESLFLAEDLDFWLRASLSFRLRPIDAVLYDYRLHGKSLTETRRREISRATETARLRWLETGRETIPRVLRGKCLEALGYQALLRGEVARGRRFLFRAMLQLRRPITFPRHRSYLPDFFLGRRLGSFLRGKTKS
jgi:glycosyltransferase involved in cell wall biosynthesis